MDKITFPFLSLPVELQTEAVNYLRNYSDLKALCLTSKHLFDIATPRLYYELDLRTDNDCWLEQRIRSLVLQPANLRFVRIIKMPQLGPRDALLMGGVLPLLRQDSLTRFKFSVSSANQFPTPLQMRFIWNHQKNLQNQKLSWHMILELDEILEERGPSEVALLKSFTALDISNRTCDSNKIRDKNIRDILSLPLKILDLSILQKLRIGGLFIGSVILPLLNTLFAGGSFVNLKKLTLFSVIFERALTLTNVPSLKSLALHKCMDNFVALPVVLADDIRLSTFFGEIWSNVEEMTLLLAQIKGGLESLHIKRGNRIKPVNRTYKEFVRAMIRHKDTLRVLNLELSLACINQLDIILWELYVVQAIKCCKKIATLSLPLVANMPIDYYRGLIASFPDLETLTIYESPTICDNWS